MRHYHASYSGFQNLHQVNKTNINRIIVFGDSLSDTGNLLSHFCTAIPSKSFYWQGRFTGGYNWVDYLAQYYDTTSLDPSFIINESVGAATAYPYSNVVAKEIQKSIFNLNIDKLGLYFMSNLSMQIEKFQRSYQFRPDDLVIIWIGANDLIWAAEQYNSRIGDLLPVQYAIASIYEEVRKILKLGVRNLMIAGLPDLDVTPRYIKTPKKSQQVSNFNLELSNKLRELLSTEFPNADGNLIFIDIDSMFKNIILANYKEFQFSNKTEPTMYGSIFSIPGIDNDSNMNRKFPIYSRNVDDHVYWDELHPSSKTHAIIASVLKRDFLEKYFTVYSPKIKNMNVVVHNHGAYVLTVSEKNTHFMQKTRSCNLAAGYSTIVTVPDGTVLNFKAQLGRSSDICIQRVSKYKNSPYELQSPSIHRVISKGTTLIGFHCEHEIY